MSDQPNFPNDDRPPAPWEQYAGQEPPESAGPDAAPPWEQFAAGDAPPSGAQQTPDWASPPESAPELPAPSSAPMPPSDEIPRGLTGDLPWMDYDQAGQPGQPSEMDDFLFNFENDEVPAPQEPVPPPAPGGGVIRRLKRDDQPTPPAPPPEPPADEEWMRAFGETAEYDQVHLSDSGADDLDWLRAEAGLGEPQASAPDEEQPPWLADDALGDLPLLGADQPGEEALPDWLNVEPEDTGQPAPSAPEDEALPDWLLQADEPPAPEPPAPGGVIRRLRPRDEEPPASMDFETWAAQAEPEETGQLSYEEWEQQQADLEREEQKTDADRMLEEVPDWFRQLDQAPEEQPPAEAPATPGGAEFIPDWYLGLEEQNVEEAPDWFQNLDLSQRSITGPLEEPAAETPAGPEPPAQEDLPDWLKGIPGAEADADWAAAFGAPPATETPAEVDLSGLGWGAETGEAAWDASLDALPDEELMLPDTGLLASLEAPGEEEPAAPGEVPDWLQAAAPEQPMIACPEDIPFPDLDLDQEPLEEAGTDLEVPGELAWMAGYAATDIPVPTPPAEEEPEDFVERFEPLEPEDFAQPAIPAPLDEDAPAWLREMAADVGTSPDLDVKDLFGQEPGDVEPVPASEEREPSYVASEEELDWLTGLSSEDLIINPEPPAPAVPEPEPEAPPAAPAEDEFSFDSAAIDDLLGLYTPPEIAPEPEPEMPPAEAAPPAAEQEVEDMSGWFEEITGVPMEPEGAPPGEGVPSQPADFEDLEQAFAAGRAAEADEAPLAQSTDQPEWLGEMRPSGLPVNVRAGGAETSVPQKQVIELPERVQAFHHLVESELIPPLAPPPAPASGPLAGIAGALPLIELAVLPEAIAPTQGPVITPEQQRRADRLQALLGLTEVEEDEAIVVEDAAFGVLATDEEAAEPVEVAKRPRRRVRFKADRLFVTLLLLVGLIVPFATDAVHFADEPPALSGDQRAVAETINELQPGDYVLFAFEYGPTSAGELDALTEAVLRDVLVRGAIPLALSTNPAGALHARGVIEPLTGAERLLNVRAQGESSLVFGEDYYVLGYLPGDAIGVRMLRNSYQDEDGVPQLHPAFNSDLYGDETDLVINVIEDDVALIAVIGGESESVRTWAEQLNGLDVPKIALVTAALEPLAIPYVEAEAYAGYLAGYRDAASYNASRNANTREPYTVPDGIEFDVPNPETARWHSGALGAAIAAGLIALGMVINLFRGLVRRGRR